jgi:gamma-glutamyltranspeptidase/glutathione hydrolase
MFMNDRTWWMGLDEGPNVVAPGHRANIGHAPTILLSNGRPYVALGSPGGFGIVQYVVQVIVNMIDYGLDVQSAIEAPRFRIEDLKGTVGLEKRISKPVIQALAALGHGVLELPEWTDRVGGVEAVYLDHATSNMLGGYDPRRNSMAAAI